MITFTLGRFHFLTQILFLTFSILNVIVKQVTHFIVFFNAHWVSFIAFFIIVLFFIEFTNHEWVIHPFDVPPSLERQGYTGRVVAFKLRNYMFELRDYINKLKSSDKS